MADVIEKNNGRRRKKSRQKKMTVRVDFTPMVDMNMLLITFFMLCTSLSKPQTMEISMPSNDKNLTEEQQSKVKASEAITLLLDANSKLYYYEGEPNYKDYTSLKETDYSAGGLRAMLCTRPDATVIIKPTDAASYKNLIDVLDEMHICSISKYVITDITPGDDFLIRNYLGKGDVAAHSDFKNS
jgi:biopolymer transport protein ExbD